MFFFLITVTHVVTPHDPISTERSDVTTSLETLHMVTGTDELTGASTHHTPASSQSPTSKQTVSKDNKPMKWSRVLNRPVEIIPTRESEVENTPNTPDTPCTSANKQTIDVVVPAGVVPDVSQPTAGQRC